MISTTATKYARALADVAGDMHLEGDILGELQEFSSLLREHHQLREVLNSPAIPFSTKRRLIERLQGPASLSNAVANFILVILENNRMKQFDDFVRAYEEVADERSGVIRVDVFSPHSLDSSVQTRLNQAITELTGSQIKLNYKIDEKLIGGLKLRMGSQIFDGSIQTQLEQIRRQLSR